MSGNDETPRVEIAVTGLNLAVTLCLNAISDQLDPDWLINSLIEQRRRLDPTVPEQKIAEDLLETAVTYLHATVGKASRRLVAQH